MSPIDHLDSLVQLHEELSIIYVVDGYRAELLTHDGDTVVQHGEGPTIESAMIDLATKLALTTLDDVRGTAP